MLFTRGIHFSRCLQFKLDPAFKFKCGLELHTQLSTKYKLFSNSLNEISTTPNSNISYFDIGLPGTQPILNPEAVYLALKTAVAVGGDIQPQSSFDRKHYFYPDQPLGYQITQYYSPIAKNGSLELTRAFDDIIQESKTIRIQQIQLEQDTGKLNYDQFDGVVKIDYNRANVPLIELITHPDFEDIEQVILFVKKYQTLVKYLEICNGELENGSLRVDVNISVNEKNRVEIKNLNSFHDIKQALIFEYQRQVLSIKEDKFIVQETRGWSGNKTSSLRSKEDAVDYRYVPDSELPKINLDPSIALEIRSALPSLPEQILKDLVSEKFQLELKYARNLLENKDILQYYYALYEDVVVKSGKQVKLVNNWLFHELLGVFTKQGVPLSLEVVPPSQLAELVVKVVNSELSHTSAKILLTQIVTEQLQGKTLDDLIELYDLGAPEDISKDDMEEAIEDICLDIVGNNQDVVAKIKKGQHKSIKYLVGLAMRETQGKVSAGDFQAKFEELISRP